MAWIRPGVCRNASSFVSHRDRTPHKCWRATAGMRTASKANFMWSMCSSPILLRKGGLLHIDHIKFALEAVRIPAAALQHLCGVRSRCDTNEDAFLHTPGRIHAMRTQIILELAVDDACGDQEC